MELLYHYLWKYKIFDNDARLCDGRPMCVKNVGLHNNNAGPDFSHARVMIDGSEWIGNVEIHVKASDWYRHGHHKDPAYDNVMLHVVAVDDSRVLRKDGSEIPQFVINTSPDVYKIYSKLTENIDNVRCFPDIPSLPPLVVSDWLESLSMERLQFKANRLKEYLSQFNHDWHQAIFILLARALGFGLNGVPFELTAKSLPLNFVRRHSDNLMQVEALLFGQAGMLDPSVNIFDEYYQNICREYSFLARKYDLRPIPPGVWKYSRIRPQNFPHLRLAILASSLCEGVSLFDKLLSASGNPQKLSDIFHWETGPYWKVHSSFGVSGSSLPHRLAESSKRLLMINVAAPFYFAYAALYGLPEWAEHAIDLLQNLPPEGNAIIRHWRSGGLTCDDALRSQALLHLRSEYCDAGKCLDCRFGNYLIRNEQKSFFVVDKEHDYKKKYKKNMIIVAQDSWKGCMSAIEANHAAADGLQDSGMNIMNIPMADGGEGTADILGDIFNCLSISTSVEDPLGRPIKVSYRITSPGKNNLCEPSTAYIDFASASGLTLLDDTERNPLLTSSFGTGQLILDARRRGASRIVLGLGGSATVDAGLGILAALGGKIYNHSGDLISHPTGGDLQFVARVIPPEIDFELILLSDVNAPLIGSNGAAYVFAPQKGADPDMVASLEASMRNLTNAIPLNLRCKCEENSGFGAAGGAAAGLSVWAGGEILDGAQFVLDAYDFDNLLKKSVLVVTGEGKADRQTLMGKTPVSVMQRALKQDVPTVLTAGVVCDRDLLINAGFSQVIDINAPYPSETDPTDSDRAKARLRNALKSLQLHL